MASMSVASPLNACVTLSSESPKKTLLAPVPLRYHPIDVGEFLPEGRGSSAPGISGKARASDHQIARLNRLSRENGINAELPLQKAQTPSRESKKCGIHQLSKEDREAVRDDIQFALIGSPLSSPRTRTKEPIHEKLSTSSEDPSNYKPLKPMKHRLIDVSSISPLSLDRSPDAEKI